MVSLGVTRTSVVLGLLLLAACSSSSADPERGLVSPAPPASAPPAPTAPAPTTPGTTPPGPAVTSVCVHYASTASSPGAVSLRGSASPLSWTTSTATVSDKPGLYTWSAEGLKSAIELKPMLGDTWSRGPNYQVEPGKTVDIYPHFVESHGTVTKRYPAFVSTKLPSTRASLGGLVSAYAGVHHADVFGLVGEMSPSTWWDGAVILGEVSSTPKQAAKPIRVYVDSGDSGASNDDVVNTTELAARYRTAGYKDHQDLLHVVQPGANDGSSAGLEPVADRIGALAETIHDRVSITLGYAPTTTTEIVLTDDTDSANGSATALPLNTIRLYVTAPDDLSPLGDYDDWYLELLTHEYTHILHTDNISGVPRIVNAVLGKTYSPNQAQPRWILEGLAVLSESQHSSAGRIRSSLFDMYLRADVLEDNIAGLDQFSSSATRASKITSAAATPTRCARSRSTACARAPR